MNNHNYTTQFRAFSFSCNVLSNRRILQIIYEWYHVTLTISCVSYDNCSNVCNPYVFENRFATKQRVPVPTLSRKPIIKIIMIYHTDYRVSRNVYMYITRRVLARAIHQQPPPPAFTGVYCVCILLERRFTTRNI